MNILAIDPGPEQSASVWFVDEYPICAKKQPNGHVLDELRTSASNDPDRILAIEMIASYGMAVGREVFETCVWIGRFVEAWTSGGGYHRLIYRRDVKLFLCQSARATDANIRAALIDLYGPGKEKAIGSKKAPGPLYELKGDTWSALAVALTARELTKPIPAEVNG